MINANKLIIINKSLKKNKEYLVMLDVVQM